jgi:hypothetical protein
MQGRIKGLIVFLILLAISGWLLALRGCRQTVVLDVTDKNAGSVGTGPEAHPRNQEGNGPGMDLWGTILDKVRRQRSQPLRPTLRWFQHICSHTGFGHQAIHRNVQHKRHPPKKEVSIQHSLPLRGSSKVDTNSGPA